MLLLIALEFQYLSYQTFLIWILPSYEAKIINEKVSPIKRTWLWQSCTVGSTIIDIYFSKKTRAPVGLRIRVWMDGCLLISCDWHFVIISFLPFLFRSVRFIYLDTFLSGLNLLLLWSKKGNKKEETKNNHKGGRGRGEMGKKTPINTSYIWILRVLFDDDLVLFWTYYSTFHVSSSLLEYSKSWSESSPFFQGNRPVWMRVTVLRHNAGDYHMTRC